MLPNEETKRRKELRGEVTALEGLRRGEFKHDVAGFTAAGHRAKLEALRITLTTMNAEFRRREQTKLAERVTKVA